MLLRGISNKQTVPPFKKHTIQQEQAAIYNSQHGYQKKSKL